MPEPVQPVGRGGPHHSRPDTDFYTGQKKDSSLNSSKQKPEREQKVNSNKLKSGIGLGLLLALGIAMKDGLSNGFKKIGDLSNSISNVISVPFSLLFPSAILNNERASIGESKLSKFDLLNRMVYTAASLGFAPNTWGDPLKMSTRSTPHMIATLLNLPHILFSFFSYTGGRFFSFITAIKKHKDPNNYRLEQEFESLYRLGNLGSAQASVIPMSGQFVLGWETILDICKGDFSSALDRFKHEPISVLLGTLFNSWAWPFEYAAKFLDTTIRTAEGVETFENAFNKNNKKSKLVSALEKLRDGWHYKSQQNDIIGNCLKWGRHASKIEALLLPPIGMVSVVTPVFNRFLRGEFWNKEAQEIGGIIGLLDKAANIGAFFSHIYYTGTYALNVRLPQTITTATFYISHLINNLRGKKAGQAGYIEPNLIRDKIFNRKNSLISWLSDLASKRLDCIELQLNPDKPTLINDIKINKNTQQIWISGVEYTEQLKDKFEHIIYYANKETNKQLTSDKNGNEIIILKGTGKCSHIRDFHKVIAEEVCYTPLREKYYAEVAKELGDIKPSERDRVWGIKLRDVYQQQILNKIEIINEDNILRKYLKESILLDDEQINEFMVGKHSNEYELIKKEVKKLIRDEINICLDIREDEHAPKKKPDVKAKSLLELLTNWKELVKVLQLKVFHVTNSILPLWIKGFVNVVDYGKENEPFWLRNLKSTETGIREGDVKQACDREFMPVVAYAFQSMGKGLATIWHLLHGKLMQPSEE